MWDGINVKAREIAIIELAVIFLLGNMPAILGYLHRGTKELGSVIKSFETAPVILWTSGGCFYCS